MERRWETDNSKTMQEQTNLTPDANDNLCLKVAERRLKECADPAEALEAIREIITNLLGSEEIALFRVGPEPETLSLWWSFGIDPEPYRTFDVIHQPTLQRVLKGEPCLEGAFETAPKATLIAGFRTLVPIRIAEQTVGVLAMGFLLPQKTCFDESDRRLLQLLSRDLGQVLFAAEVSLDD